MAAEFSRAGYQVTENVGGHGVVAVLENGPGKTVLIRADMDALPLPEPEATGLEYASNVTTQTKDGQTAYVMHGCGHDLHMTCIVGTARIMARLKDRWSGTLVLIAQPAEELGIGADGMIKAGLFTMIPHPDACLALHADAEREAGQVAYVSAFSRANVDGIDIKIKGVSAHSAYPHKAKDPIVIAAQTILALQTIVSREVDPTKPAVITVGKIVGGTKRSQIPSEVQLQLTVRSYHDDVRKLLLESIQRTAVNTARAAGISEEDLPEVVHTGEGAPALYNDPGLVNLALAGIAKAIGKANVVQGQPTMGGEDFSYYGTVKPSFPLFMWTVGTVSPEDMKKALESEEFDLPSLHSPHYAPHPRPSIRTGVLSQLGAALAVFSE
jgi:hippurate hydrolase